MLYYRTINTKTLELLKRLQNIPEFSDLRLVGGTSLALQLGHRISIDLDLFGLLSSDIFSISKKLDEIGTVKILNKTENINVYIIDGIKVDIVNYHYKWLELPVEQDGLILADQKDIAAMKLAAITGRGTKKDFIDLYFLFQHFTLKQMLEFYNQKYFDGSEFLVLKSLSYFDDADKEIMPNMLVFIDWEHIKNTIKKELNNYMNSFEG